MNPAHNIYIHVPFCASKCNYCAFYSCAVLPDWNAYLADILARIKEWGMRLGRIKVPTIFFGGGTPSLMHTGVFQKIMDALRAAFDVLPDAEITLEANPGTLDNRRLCQFAAAGINRLSVGVQSFNDDDLIFLGRRHNADMARRLIGDALDTGMRVSGDFIYALPGQSVSDVEIMCKEILATGLSHASIYELSIEKGTAFAQQKMVLPFNEVAAQMYELVGHTLSDKLSRYEVSNYATPGFECAHNMNIWNGCPYIGIGPAACGRPLIGGAWYEQRQGTDNDDIFQVMTNSDRAIEMIMTGLRTVHGCGLSPDILRAINMDFVRANPDKVQITGDRIRATEKGLLILDDLMVNLIS